MLKYDNNNNLKKEFLKGEWVEEGVDSKWI